MSEGTQQTCPSPQCDYPDVSCELGHVSAADCPHFTPVEQAQTPERTADHTTFPWTGRPLGLNDLRFVAGRRKPLVLGVIGSANAGKTTLLAMLYLMVQRGIPILEKRQFAGSYTLEGWEYIARWLQLKPSSPIQFPPHTTSKGERAPGLLHLAFATDHTGKRDILVTDAPGEWFDSWTSNADDPSAAGARWISDHAEKFLLIADTEALTGDRGGPSRLTLEFLTTRLADRARGRSVALVWTKTDIQRPDMLIETVENHFLRLFPGAPIFNVHVPLKASENSSDLGHVDDIKAVFAWGLEDPTDNWTVLRSAPQNGADPFFSYGKGTT